MSGDDFLNHRVNKELKSAEEVAEKCKYEARIKAVDAIALKFKLRGKKDTAENFKFLNRVIEEAQNW